MILELLPGAADRAALRASCQALRAVLDATVDHITVALWRYASAKSDDWGAAPSQLPALLARHPAAAALVLRRAQYMWEVVPSLGGNDIGLRDFSNSVGIAAKEVGARIGACAQSQ